MDRIDEQTLELFAHRPESLQDSVRRSVEMAIENDPYTRSVVSFYREYYDELSRADDKTSPRLEAFIEHLFAEPQDLDAIYRTMRDINARLERGDRVSDILSELHISKKTYYRWRKHLQ